MKKEQAYCHVHGAIKGSISDAHLPLFASFASLSSLLSFSLLHSFLSVFPFTPDHNIYDIYTSQDRYLHQLLNTSNNSDFTLSTGTATATTIDNNCNLRRE